MKLKIKIGNVEFEAEGNEAEIKRERTAMTEFLEHLASINTDIVLPVDTSQLTNDGITQRNIPTRTIIKSFNDFLRSTPAKKDTDIIMAAAYFLYKFQEKEIFTSKDIESLLTESHIKRPNNISQAIIQNIKKGFISSVKQSDSKLKTYQVTTAADEWYENIQTDANPSCLPHSTNV